MSPPMPGTGQPPANTGPGTAPGQNPGNLTAAKLQIGHGLTMLQQALPNIPMGSPLHSDILKSVQTISKHMQQDGPQDQGLQASAGMAAIRQQAQQGPQMAALRMMGGGTSAPSAPPAMPQQDDNQG